MPILDNRTILFTQLFVGFFLFLYSLFTVGNVGKRSLFLYRLSNLSYSLGFLLLYLQFTGNRFFTVILSNTLILLSFLLFSKTVLSIIKIERQDRIFLWLLLENTLSFFVFTYFFSSTLMRILVISSNIIITLSLAIIFTRKRMGNRRKTINIFLVSTGSYILVSLFRIFYTISNHLQIDSIFSLDGATSLIFLATIAYHVSLNSIIFLLINTQYRADLTEKVLLLEQSHQDIQNINSFLGNYQKQLEPDLLYRDISSYLMERFFIDGCFLFSIDEENESLVLIHYRGVPLPDSDEPHKIGLNSSTLSVECIRKKQTLFKTLQPDDDLLFSKELLEAGFVRLASIPIRSSSGIIGALTLGTKSHYSLLEKEMEIITLISNQLGTLLENAAQYQRLTQLATTDPLTGVSNRRALLQHFEEARQVFIRYHRPVTLLMADIDKFKNINDTYGHETGDQVLKKLVSLAEGLLRESDVLGRFGGEEFIILLKETTLEQGFILAERLRTTMEQNPLETDQGLIPFTISIGVTHILPDDTARKTLDRVDQAMYEAKNRGRNCTVIFQDEEL